MGGPKQGVPIKPWPSEGDIWSADFLYSRRNEIFWVSADLSGLQLWLNLILSGEQKSRDCTSEVNEHGNSLQRPLVIKRALVVNFRISLMIFPAKPPFHLGFSSQPSLKKPAVDIANAPFRNEDWDAGAGRITKWEPQQQLGAMLVKSHTGAKLHSDEFFVTCCFRRVPIGTNWRYHPFGELITSWWKPLKNGMNI